MFTYELQRRLSGAATTIALAAHPASPPPELTRNTPRSPPQATRW